MGILSMKHALAHLHNVSSHASAPGCRACWEACSASKQAVALTCLKIWQSRVGTTCGSLAGGAAVRLHQPRLLLGGPGKAGLAQHPG